MNSTPSSKPTESQGAADASADERLAHAHQEIKRADEQLTRLTEQVARMERDTAPVPSTALRPLSPSAGPVPQSLHGGPALRTLLGLALAACVVVAALVLQLSYGDDARATRPASSSALPPEDPPAPAQPAQPPVQLAAAEAASLQAPPPQAPHAPILAQTTPAPEASPTATAAPSDQAQLLQTIARDLANLERTIEQLKTNQQQMANDNAKAIGELQASQEEMKRALAKVSEPSPPKTSAPAAKPAPIVRRPERSPSQTRSRPRYPREWMYEDDW